VPETVITDLSLDDLRAFLAAATLAGALDGQCRRAERVLVTAIIDPDLDAATWERLVAATESLCPEPPEPAPVWEPHEPLLALPTYQPPVSTEARYARSKGRYGRRRGEDDPAPQMQSAPVGAGALRIGWSGRGHCLEGNSDTRRIPRPPPHNQPPIGAVR